MNFPHATSWTEAFKKHVSTQVNTAKADCFEKWEGQLDVTMWLTYKSYMGYHVDTSQKQTLFRLPTFDRSVSLIGFSGSYDSSFYYVFDVTRLPKLTVVTKQNGPSAQHHVRVLMADGAEMSINDLSIPHTHLLDECVMSIFVETDRVNGAQPSTSVNLPCMFQAKKYMH
jgi:hypothetical protein